MAVGKSMFLHSSDNKEAKISDGIKCHIEMKENNYREKFKHEGGDIYLTGWSGDDPSQEVSFELMLN